MVRSELISWLARKTPGLARHDAEKIIAAVLGEISTTLEAGGRVELRGFGTFSLRTRRPRTARNPRTGVPVRVAERTVPVFRPGKDIAARLAKSSSSPRRPR